MGADGGIWVQALAAVALVSALSLIGSLTLVGASKVLDKFLIFVISFAAGALLGDAFLHLLPEIAESERGFDFLASMSVLGGITGFFLLEKGLHWHHAHFPHEEVVHPVAVSNLIGDGLHNFVDGAIVAGSFLVSPQLGIATTIAVVLHEVPQELGDFAILVHAGLKPRRALLLNFLSGLVAIAGAVATLLLDSIGGIEQFLVPFSAGAFIYIASTDLIPELHKEPEPMKSVAQGLALIGGIAVMAALTLVE
ncbi:MAG: ZIP family metal transporter [Actinomycetota bacterium]|nr:ZIP family metal transporter [Actinomycetota bacterium]